MQCLLLSVSAIFFLAVLTFAYENFPRNERRLFDGLSSVWSYGKDEEAQKKMVQSQKREDSFVKYAKKFYPSARARPYFGVETAKKLRK